MAVDLEYALLKAQNKSGLSPEEVLALLELNDQEALNSFELDSVQLHSVKSWVKLEAQRLLFDLASTPKKEG